MKRWGQVPALPVKLWEERGKNRGELLKEEAGVYRGKGGILQNIKGGSSTSVPLSNCR